MTEQEIEGQNMIGQETEGQSMAGQETEEQSMTKRRRQRIGQMRQEKRRQQRIRRYLRRMIPVAVCALLLMVIIIFTGGRIIRHFSGNSTKNAGISRNESEKGADGEKSSLEKQGIHGEKEDTGDTQAVNGAEIVLNAGITADNSADAGENDNCVTAKTSGTSIESNLSDSKIDQPGQSIKELPEPQTYYALANERTAQPGEEVASSYAILIDIDNSSILSQREAKTRMNPASMTKILTVLVAAEHLDNLEDTFTMTRDITDYSYVNDCSIAGFAVDETVTVRDLFYGTVLPSGADAAVALATLVSGSQEEFVELMNQKLKELGLSATTHVTNCVGIYDDNHYSTAYDMAMILEAAIHNEKCREFLSAHKYTTSKTKQHPEGITLSNWFLRRIEDKDTGGEVVCGKTGYVQQSGSCAASYAVDKNGRKFICVTADAHSPWRCIYDHVELYKKFSAST